MTKRRAAIGVLVVLACSALSVGPASAAVVTHVLTFDERAEIPANGVHIDGVQFGYTIGGVASNVALYGDYGPGITKYVSDPSLTGLTTGVLTLAFDRPTKLLGFGLALDVPTPLSPGFTVQLFDRRNNLLATVPVNTKVPVDFSEARFVSKGLAIKKAVVTFDSTVAADFALDNLTYRIAA